MSTTYTKAQIAAAREIDLLSYLEQAEPGTVRRSASGEHCLVEHDSFKISNGRWFWHSRVQWSPCQDHHFKIYREQL